MTSRLHNDLEETYCKIADNRPFSLVHFVFPMQIMCQYLGGSVLCFGSLKRVHADIFMLACALLMSKTKN